MRWMARRGEGMPYSAAESNFTIVPLQPKADNRYAVFFTHPREAITLHYERNAADPRIGHELTLEVDDYGNVLRSAAIGYQRRGAGLRRAGRDARDADRERRHQRGARPGRLPHAAAGRGPDLPVDGAGIARRRTACRSRWSRRSPRRRSPIPYEAAPAAGAANKRLIEHVRTLYRADDLAACCRSASGSARLAGRKLQAGVDRGPAGGVRRQGAAGGAAARPGEPRRRLSRPRR